MSTPASSAPGLLPITSGGGTSTAGGGTTDLTGSLAEDLSNNLLSPSSESSPGFDPVQFLPGGIFSSTPFTQQVPSQLQDPSGQLADQGPSVVDRTLKGDRADVGAGAGVGTQPPVDRGGTSAVAEALSGGPSGPTSAPGGDTAAAGTPGGKQPSGIAALLQQAGIPPEMTKFLTQPAAKDKDQAQVPGQPKAAQQQPTPQQEPQATQQQQQQQPGGAAQAPPGSRGESLPTPTGAPAGGDIAAAAQAARARGGATDPLQSILNSLGMGGTPLAGLARQLMAPSPDYARPPAGGMGGGESQPVGGGGARNAYARAYGGDVPGMSDNGVPAPGQTGEVTAPTEDHIRQSRAAGTDTPPTAGFSPYLAQERSPFAEELNRNPRTKWETLAVLAMEHDSDPAAVAESLLNRSKYAGTSVSNMLHSGFYGPVNSGRLGREVAALQRDPQRAAKLNAGLETALRGSNLLGGATDQGSHRDPNVGWKGGRVVRMGEVYNDWAGGPGGHAGAALFRKMQQQRVRQMGEQADLGKRLFAMDITQGKRPDLYGAEIQGSIGSARARGGESIGRSRAQGDVMMDEERRKREKGRRIEAEAL